MKLTLSPFRIVVAVVWVVSLGFIGVGAVLFGGSRRAAVEQAHHRLRESQERLAFARHADTDETRRQTLEQLAQTRLLVSTFSCAAASESALIFRIGQLAHSLQLKKFTSRVPENVPDRTLEKSDRIEEGWLTVEFSADYLKTAAFINVLERHEPALFVETLSLSRSDEHSDEAFVRIGFSYLIRKPAASPAAARTAAAF